MGTSTSRSREKTTIKEPYEEQAKTNASISQLPYDILVNILSRLPLKTIFRCRSVCKSWLNLFSDPYFTETHFKLAPTCLLLQPDTQIVGLKRKPDPFMVDWNVPNLFDDFDDAIINFDPSFITFINRAIMVNSCNGLLCLGNHLFRGSYCVCNPISGEFVFIPLVEDSGGVNVIKFWFGFSPVSNRYKVVQFLCPIYFLDSDRRWATLIFSIGEDSVWRSIEESFKPAVAQEEGQTSDAYLNGRIHWIVNDCNTCTVFMICCFDFDCEGYRSVSPPLELKTVDIKRSKWVSLGVMGGGCLCIFDYSVDNYFDIWMMMEYGVEESWMKKFVISAPFSCTLRFKDSCSKISFLDTGKCLMFFNEELLVSYKYGGKTICETRFLYDPALD